MALQKELDELDDDDLKDKNDSSDDEESSEDDKASSGDDDEGSIGDDDESSEDDDESSADMDELEQLVEKMEMNSANGKTKNVLYWKLHTEDTMKASSVLVLPISLRSTVLSHLHNARVSGHLGRKKTLEKVRERYSWVGCAADVAQWCKTCLTCQQKGKPLKSQKAPQKLYNLAAPLERMSLDIMGPLPESNRGNRYILCVGDYFTKWITAIPLPNQEVSTVATALLENIFTVFGLPNQLHSDLGTNFESKLFTQLCELLGVDKTRSTSYRPQSNGFIELANRTIQAMLRPYIFNNQKDWDEHLQYVMLAYRSSVQESTNFTPSKLMFGRQVRLPVDLMYGNPPSHNPANDLPTFVQNQKERMEVIHEQVRDNLRVTSERQKRTYDHNSSRRNFVTGQTVWYYYPARKKGISPKFQSFWKGPYAIVEQISDILYRIKPEGHQKSPFIVHVDKLKPYVVPEMPELNSPDCDITLGLANSHPKTRSGREVKAPQWYGIPG